MKVIPYGRQQITDSDLESVIETLKSDYLTQGPKVREFEEAFAKYVGSNYAVAVSNGTAALHLCALAFELESGDKVITTPITFAASANCVRYCGAEVVFADIDPETYLLDIHSVKNLLDDSPPGTYKGIIPVDFAGRSVNMEEFRKLADQYNLWIIEDACHAPGGHFIDSDNKEVLCGSGLHADLAIFSFHPVKHIATGEGGMITTNSEELYQSLIKLRTHGITKNSDQFINDVDLAIGEESSQDDQTYPNWYMEMQHLGFNYRLTDFQSALGISQLKRAKEGIAKRRAIATKYFEAFDGKEFIYGQSGVVPGHAYHLYVIEVENRLGLYNHLRSQNIFAQIHYIPCHLMPYYKELGWSKGDFPNAESYYSRCISLPMFPTLEDSDVDFIIDSINKFYS